MTSSITEVPEVRRGPAAIACLVIVLAGVRVYANSMHVPFLFDDLPSIVENPTIRSLSNFRQVLSPPHGGETVGGRPILNLSFALNYALSGSHVWSWHVGNIAIHMLAGLCLFGIVHRTLAMPVVPEQQIRRAIVPALAVALLWTVHPLTTESVTYIVQRAESLAGLCLLLTLYCSIRSAQASAGLYSDLWCRRLACPAAGETPAPQLSQNNMHPTIGRGWQIAAIVACLVGMATKEVMVVAPLLVVLYDWAFLGNTLAGTLKSRGRFYAVLASTWILLGALVLGSATRGGSAGFGQGMGIWDYARAQFGFIMLYLKLCFWPHPLVLDYGDQIAAASAQLIPAIGLVSLLAALTLAALFSNRYRPLGFLGACFFCILAPTSSILPVVTQTGAEHRMYLPLAAVVALVVLCGDRLWSRISTRWPAPWQTIPPFAVLVVAALTLGMLTVRRNADYRTEASIWTDTAAKRPENWRAHFSVGWVHFHAREWEAALAAYDRSIALKATEFAPLQFRGFTHLKLRNFEEAEVDFLLALALNKRDAATHSNLATARAGAGELDPALASITEAVRLAPTNADFHRSRGDLLTRLRRHDEALEEFTEAVSRDPQSAAAYQDRGRCYQALKRHAEAIDDFSKAIAINPKQHSYVLDRAMALDAVERFEESIADCSAALVLKPELAAAYRTRAMAYVHLKRYENARADLAELQRLGLKPDPQLLDRLNREEAVARSGTAGIDDM